MDWIVTLIVIIVLVNLFNRLLGAGQRKRQPGRRPGTARFEPPLPERQAEQVTGDPFYYRYRRQAAPYADDDFDDEHEEEPREEPAGQAADGVEEEDLEVVKRRVRKSAPGAPAAKKFSRLLTSKDSLLSAFIFHEVLAGPPASRKRRGSVFSRRR